MQIKALKHLISVPPPVPPRGNRDKDTGHLQGTNICHVSTTYIGGPSSESSVSQPIIAPATKSDSKSGLGKSVHDEVTIGSQSTHSSQVNVTNKQNSLLQKPGLQLQISVNSSSIPSGSSNTTSTLISRQSSSNVSSTSTVLPRNTSTVKRIARQRRIRRKSRSFVIYC